MVWETLQNLGIFATGTAAAGLVLRYGIQRFSGLVERGIDRSAEVAERGIDRFSEVAERGIEAFVDEKIARHEAELEDRRAVASGLHQERASVVLELYQRFVRFERDVRALETGRSSGPSTDELLQQARESGNDFATYYAEHKIYLPPATCTAVERVQEATNVVFDDFRASTSHGGRPDQSTAIEPGLANRRDVTRDELSDLTGELENHFRELLGVDLD